MTLSSLSHGAGCKLPADLLPILRQLPLQRDPRLPVGAATGDDAAVFQLRPDLAIVQAVDFLTPIVDDPFDFGRIAAANAMSDVYAMGTAPDGTQSRGISLEQLDGDVLLRVLEGGLAVAAEAGDPATSGGLRVSLPRQAVAEFEGTVVGRMVEGEPGAILVS